MTNPAVDAFMKIYRDDGETQEYMWYLVIPELPPWSGPWSVKPAAEWPQEWRSAWLRYWNVQPTIPIGIYEFMQSIALNVETGRIILPGELKERREGEK